MLSFDLGSWSSSAVGPSSQSNSGEVPVIWIAWTCMGPAAESVILGGPMGRMQLPTTSRKEGRFMTSHQRLASSHCSTWHCSWHQGGSLWEDPLFVVHFPKLLVPQAAGGQCFGGHQQTPGASREHNCGEHVGLVGSRAQAKCLVCLGAARQLLDVQVAACSGSVCQARLGPRGLPARGPSHLRLDGRVWSRTAKV